MLIAVIVSARGSVSASVARHAFWLAAMFTPILTIELPVGAGRVLSVSAFDAVVLLVFIGLCRPYRPAGLRPAASGLWPFGLFAALAVAHSAAFLALGSDLQLPGLVRETVKYVGFAATVAMLVMIFRTAPMDAPPPRETLAGAALVIGLGAMVFTWSPIAIIGGSHATVIGSMLTVIAMLLVGTTKERDRPCSATSTSSLCGVPRRW